MEWEGFGMVALSSHCHFFILPCHLIHLFVLLFSGIQVSRVEDRATWVSEQGVSLMGESVGPHVPCLVQATADGIHRAGLGIISIPLLRERASSLSWRLFLCILFGSTLPGVD